MSRIIPSNSLKITIKGVVAVVYFYENNGQYLAKGYHGKVKNPSFHFTFKTAQKRLEHLNHWIEEIKQKEARKTEYKNDRNQAHNIQLGDIFKSVWGYEQTNVDYYECVKVCGKIIEVREIKGEILHDDKYMTGKSVPMQGAFCGKVIRTKVAFGNQIKIKHHRATLMTPDIVGGIKIYQPSNYTDYA